MTSLTKDFKPSSEDCYYCFVEPKFKRLDAYPNAGHRLCRDHGCCCDRSHPDLVRRPKKRLQHRSRTLIIQNRHISHDEVYIYNKDQIKDERVAVLFLHLTFEFTILVQNTSIV